MSFRARKAWSVPDFTTCTASMATSTPKPCTVDEYILGFAPEVQNLLRNVRAVVREAAPQAKEVISYGMPALKQHGILVYFAAFKAHIGFYPPIKGDAALEAEAAQYAGEKGNLRFPYSAPIPYELIGKLAALRAKQDAEKRKTGVRGRPGSGLAS
jgi:uncharacterized protein YdhG (YjbR/CyaY superfamily)